MLVTGQERALQYIASIERHRDRVLMEYLLSYAVGHVTRSAVREGAPLTPFDLESFVKIAHEALRNHRLVDAITSGKYRAFSEVPDLF